MGRSEKDRTWYDSVRESYVRSEKSPLEPPHWVLDESLRYNWNPSEQKQEGSREEVFDPWKNPIAKDKRLYFKKSAEARGLTNVTSPHGVKSYVLDETDEDMCLDPIALALHRHRQKFVEDVDAYVAPYDVQIFFETVQLSAPQAYNLRLLFNSKEVNHRRIPFATAYAFRVDLQDLYDEFDNMIEEFEGKNNTKRVRKIESIVHSKTLSNVALTSIETRYANKFRGVGKLLAKATESKKQQDILCPVHGNPMMARKNEPGVLRCLVNGCTKRAKLKVKQNASSGMTLGQKLNAVLNDPEERPDVDLGAVTKVISEAAPVDPTFVENLKKMQEYFAPQSTSNAVGVTQTKQLGYQQNNQPVFVHYDQHTQNLYLYQRDQNTGQDVWIDVTRAGGNFDVRTDISGLCEVTVTLYPRMEGNPY